MLADHQMLNDLQGLNWLRFYRYMCLVPIYIPIYPRINDEVI